ncbi:ribosomal protein L17a [Zea mays]|uniref:Ribosomal protein L17a n=1 Tax=Zea mays TaxID=4577 RepID=A0A1D6FNJ6_MAIZE|nr:ribosomal protein L17a [Zea mays]
MICLCPTCFPIEILFKRSYDMSVSFFLLRSVIACFKRSYDMLCHFFAAFGYCLRPYSFPSDCTRNRSS